MVFLEVLHFCHTFSFDSMLGIFKLEEDWGLQSAANRAYSFAALSAGPLVFQTAKLHNV